MKSRIGKFIVLEGLEGAGKTTAQKLLAEIMYKYAINDIVFIREPGGTPIAEKLREIHKYSIDNEVITDKAEILMLYAARIQLIENVIKPALAKGTWVIGDRHDLSSQAYQGGGRQISQQLLTSLKTLVLENFAPDLTIYLDIDPLKGLERARQREERADRIETTEQIDFFTRVRNKYLELTSHIENCIIVDANKEWDTVSIDLRNKLEKWIKKQI